MAMALVHELLYNSDNIARIDFSVYVDKLVQNLYHIYRNQLERIQLNISVSELELGIDTAVPCGLLINEMLTNAVKHAFPDEMRGEVCIGLSNTPEGYIELIVRDNGIGISEAIDIRNNKTMGLELILGITEIQLGGKVELKNKEGTEIKVRFKPVKERRKDVGQESFNS
ncbi:MAG: sensor histidine kinase [Nitrospirae bacterium]|nr:sensor histidine kinase [Nitrospirota bacterium]